MMTIVAGASIQAVVTMATLGQGTIGLINSPPVQCVTIINKNK